MWWLYNGASKSSVKDDGGFKVKTTRDGVQIMAKRLTDLLPLMQRIGEYLKKRSQIAFLNQAYGNKKWPARKTPSIMGIVQDLTQGPDVSVARFNERPALVDSGNLRRSIRYAAGRKTVTLYSTAEYANLMQQGGPSSLPVTASVKANLATFLRSNRDLRPRLGFLFNRTSVSVIVPPRPFLGNYKEAKPQIEELALNFLRSDEGEALLDDQ